MRFFILFLIIELVFGCFPTTNLSPRGSLTNGEDPGYWKLTSLSRRGKLEPPKTIPGRSLLEIQTFRAEKDSLEEPLYEKGFPYLIFSFYDSALKHTKSLQCVQSDHKYESKQRRSQFWYRINADSGFVAILDIQPGGDMKTYRIEISNVMKSASYRPELDSLRYIYEPTAKFK